jgi:spore germination protein GerM
MHSRWRCVVGVETRTGSRSRRGTVWLTTAAFVFVGCSGDAGDPTGSAEVGEATTIEVFFTNTELGGVGEVFPVDRRTTEDDLPLAAAEALLAGPTDEEQEGGYSSWFSAETADLPVTLEVTERVAYVDLDPSLPSLIPGASSSAGSTALLAELDATIGQFPDIDEVRYALGGDVEAFWSWLQRSPPDGADTGADPPEQPDGETAAPGDQEEVTVQVFFHHADRGSESDLFAVERRVEPPAVLRGALQALLEGPTGAELDEGYHSWFSSDTAGLLDDVRLEDGVAYVAFDASLPDVIPNASTSAGSARLLTELDATVTQFDGVDEVVYSLEGDTGAFYEWLQLVAPT